MWPKFATLHCTTSNTTDNKQISIQISAANFGNPTTSLTLSLLSSYTMGSPDLELPDNVIYNSFFEIPKPTFRLYGPAGRYFSLTGICKGRRSQFFWPYGVRGLIVEILVNWSTRCILHVLSDSLCLLKVMITLPDLTQLSWTDQLSVHSMLAAVVTQMVSSSWCELSRPPWSLQNLNSTKFASLLSVLLFHSIT